MKHVRMPDLVPEVESNGLRVGQAVKAVKDVFDDGDCATDLVASAGTFGRVVALYRGQWPTIRWEETGRVSDTAPHRFVAAAADLALTPLPWGQPARRQ